jgi:hypothetical protein
MKLYYIKYEVVDPRTGKKFAMINGPYTEEEILEQFRNVKRTAGIVDAYVTEKL